MGSCLSACPATEGWPYPRFHLPNLVPSAHQSLEELKLYPEISLHRNLENVVLTLLQYCEVSPQHSLVAMSMSQYYFGSVL